jgi:tetratricopeptide (TPR) repeat protein
MSIKSNLVIALTSLVLASPGAFAKDVKEPPAPGSTGGDVTAKVTMSSDLLAAGIKSFEKNKNDEALKQFNSVLGLDEKNLCALYYRGLTNKKLGKQEAAKKDFKAATALPAVTADEYEARGKSFQHCGDKTKADADLDKARSLKK